MRANWNANCGPVMVPMALDCGPNEQIANGMVCRLHAWLAVGRCTIGN